MKFFSREETKVKTGTEALREKLRIRLKHGPLASLARDLNIGTGALENFATASGRLPNDVMTALAKDLFGSNVEFDAERDLLSIPAPSTALPPPPPILFDEPVPLQPKED